MSSRGKQKFSALNFLVISIKICQPPPPPPPAETTPETGNQVETCTNLGRNIGIGSVCVEIASFALRASNFVHFAKCTQPH